MIENQEMITKIFKNNDITPSYTRLKIYDYLSKDKFHPTVDEIYMDLVEFFPTLSKTTVYNTLKLFVEKNIIRAISLNDNKMRYELIKTNHSHLKCDICSTVYDIPADINIYLPKELKGTIINENHLLITGTCSYCLDKQ